ncbi:hypothetical protein EVAR_6439_1 [Eumeta japonica]|uniref:Uncharacterized protein n=1 Tax=Eumeta variegata TaxID=151549 RepID=A0A4C1TCM1_EUMVA|nr:hypothetical protein EVAR_6439_1 [Eumeta japonica]
MYTAWYSRGDNGMHHHNMGQLYHHGPPMIKTEAGVNSDCMMAVDYAPPIKSFMINTINRLGEIAKSHLAIPPKLQNNVANLNAGIDHC